MDDTVWRAFEKYKKYPSIKGILDISKHNGFNMKEILSDEILAETKYLDARKTY